MRQHIRFLSENNNTSSVGDHEDGGEYCLALFRCKTLIILAPVGRNDVVHRRNPYSFHRAHVILPICHEFYECSVIINTRVEFCCKSKARFEAYMTLTTFPRLPLLRL